MYWFRKPDISTAYIFLCIAIINIYSLNKHNKILISESIFSQINLGYEFHDTNYTVLSDEFRDVNYSTILNRTFICVIFNIKSLLWSSIRSDWAFDFKPNISIVTNLGNLVHRVCINKAYQYKIVCIIGAKLYKWSSNTPSVYVLCRLLSFSKHSYYLCSSGLLGFSKLRQ